MNGAHRTLVTRTDGMGDVLLAGPAIRALAATGTDITILAGPAGAPAARRLPGAARVIVTRLPWIDADPQPLTPRRFGTIVDTLRAARASQAVLLGSFHQSPLPLALACRLAGIPRIVAISDDYPGSLIDVRHGVPADLHEVERNLSVAAAAGALLPRDDDGRLCITMPTSAPGFGAHHPPYVVVHPSASVSARTLAPAQWRSAVAALAEADHDVVVTGTAQHRGLHAAIATGMPSSVRTTETATFDELARVVADAAAIVVGNTGPAHVAAAVGTPVVSVFAPTVPTTRWRPWMVPHVLLGDLQAPCRHCRARTCPLPGQPCLRDVTGADIVAAVAALQKEVALL